MERGEVKWWSVAFGGVLTVARPAIGRSPSVSSVRGSLVDLLSFLCLLVGVSVDFPSFGGVR